MNKRTMLRKRDYIAWWVKYGNSLCYFTHNDQKSYESYINDCSLVQLRYVYGQTINSYAELWNFDPIVKGYDPYSDSESAKDSGSKDGNGLDVGEDDLLEEEAVLSTSENDSVNENRIGMMKVKRKMSKRKE